MGWVDGTMMSTEAKCTKLLEGMTLGWLAAIALALTTANGGCEGDADPALGDDDTGDDDTDGDDTDEPSCDGEAGTFHDLQIDVDGEARFYALHVPDAYDCADPWPVLMDFHGTAGAASPGTAVEEYYAQDELEAVADDRGFIAVRPRSRYLEESPGMFVFRWDENAGDLERNVAFTRELLTWLSDHYHLDPDRIYASGFSNGTNMAVQLLAEDDLSIDGYGLVGGGVWAHPDYPTFDGDAPPIYAVSGYRDYMVTYLRELVTALEERGYPDEQLWWREEDSSHELYGWHFDEIWRWIDLGQGQGSGTLAAGWAWDEGFDGETSLLALGPTPDGALLATGTAGDIWRRDHLGTWTHLAQLDEQPLGTSLTAVCSLDSGRAVAVGEGLVALSDDGLTWIEGAAIPDFSGYLGTSFTNAVACGGERAVAGGYWNGALSDDGGASWTESPMLLSAFDIPASVAGLAMGDQGTTVAAGYHHFLAVGLDGDEFGDVSVGSSASWFYDAATSGPGRWCAVGDHGAIVCSADDGASWQVRSTGGLDVELYAIDFADDLTGLAVGSHGAALLTEDGGETWVDVHTGLDVYLGAVRFLDAITALVVGEDGTALIYSL
jgi:poly(3-hydroxybutyrate) depolymerase